MTSRSGGFSKARLGRMRDVMTAHVERGGIPGLVTLASRRDEVHVEAIGRQADGGGPMRRLLGRADLLLVSEPDAMIEEQGKAGDRVGEGRTSRLPATASGGRGRRRSAPRSPGRIAGKRTR